MSMEQQPPMPPQLPQQAIPYVQLQGREALDLLEITTGRSVLEEDEQWYSKSRLLPLANLNEHQQRFIIWIGFAECWNLMRISNPFSENTLNQIDEYRMSLIGQSSRALKGLERLRLATTNFSFQTQQEPVQQRRKGILGFLTGGR